MKHRVSFSVTVLALSLLGGAIALPSAKAATLILDQGFRAPGFAQPAPALDTLLLPNGKFLRFSGTDTLTDRSGGAITRYHPDGTLDSSFSFSRDYKDVSAAASVGKGRIIIAATRPVYGRSRVTEQLLRLNPDGSLDATFNATVIGLHAAPTVQAIAVAGDGRILVAGFFDTFGGAQRQKLVRLLPDGSIDAAFNPPQFSGGSGIWARPAAVAGGKIIVAGDFTSVNGTATQGVAQLNFDGSLDTTFEGSGFLRSTGTPIRAIGVQSDGRIVLAGRFFMGPGALPLVRLHPDGAAETGYRGAYGDPTPGRDLLVQPDGKVVFSAGSSIYRRNVDGSADSSFAYVSFADYAPGSSWWQPGAVFAMNLQPDGRILCGGAFNAVNYTQPRLGLASLNPNGTLDPALVTTARTGIDTPPTSFLRVDDGSTMVAFGTNNRAVEPAIPFNVGRLLTDGSLDPKFTLSSGNSDSLLASHFLATDFAELQDGGLFIFGTATGPVGAKFSTRGAEDAGFRFTYSPAFQKASVFPDGKLLLSAGSDPQATVEGALSRRTSSGTFESETFFNLPQSIAGSQITRDPITAIISELFVGSHVLSIQPDGKVLFLYFSRDRLFRFVRLHADGSLDNTFATTTFEPIDLTRTLPSVFDPRTGLTSNPQTWSASPPLLDAHLMADGRVVLAGRFTSFQGVAARGMVRLHPNGMVDGTFNTGGGAQWSQLEETPAFFPIVESIEEQVDGRLLIAGTFEVFGGTELPGIASLHSDGSVDASFVPTVRRLKFVASSAELRRQADGSFLLSGPYAFPDESEPSFIRIETVGGVPVVGSPGVAHAVVDRPFEYRIVASGQPTNYGASGLPSGFTVDASSGLIQGTATNAQIGLYQVLLTATGPAGTSAPRQLSLTVPDAPELTAAVSRISHGNAGEFGIDLPLTGEPGVECRRRTSEGNYTLVFTFNHPVVSGFAAITNGAGTLSEEFWAEKTMRLGIGAAADRQTLTVTLSGVTDRFGQVLPDRAVSLHILNGDTNGNKTVNATDISQTKGQSGATVTSANFRTDVNASGSINASDIAQVKAKAGQTLASPTHLSRSTPR